MAAGIAIYAYELIFFLLVGALNEAALIHLGRNPGPSGFDSLG
jgi:hypothetical protein